MVTGKVKEGVTPDTEITTPEQRCPLFSPLEWIPVSHNFLASHC